MVRPPTLLLLALLPIGFASAAPTAAVPPAPRPNILFIAVDDLNTWISCMRPEKKLITPHLDQLAGEGVKFLNAHCASPSCHPSRVALMTGRSPLKTGITRNLKNVPSTPSWRLSPLLKDAVTLPEFLKGLGYSVKGGGKIFHGTQYDRMEENDPAIWDDFFPSKQRQIPEQPVPPFDYFKRNKDSGRPQGHLDWTPLAVEDREMSDYKVVDWALGELKQEHTKPFFLAVGLFRPHVPFQLPEKYYDLYPRDQIELPATYPPGVRPAPAVTSLDVVGAFGRRSFLWARENNHLQDALRGYFAGVTFCDTMIGRLLKGLRESRYAESTIVILFSDNGYHLAEKERFEKFTLWSESTRVPLLIKAPGVSTAGGICRRPVSLLDLYPTIVELSGGRKPAGLDGESLVPWLKNPAAGKSTPAVVVGPEPGSWAIVTNEHRYISYFDGTDELYDLREDPGEFRNLAGAPAQQSLKAALRNAVPRQVPEFIPLGASPN